MSISASIRRKEVQWNDTDTFVRISQLTLIGNPPGQLKDIWFPPHRSEGQIWALYTLKPHEHAAQVCNIRSIHSGVVDSIELNAGTCWVRIGEMENSKIVVHYAQIWAADVIAVACEPGVICDLSKLVCNTITETG